MTYEQLAALLARNTVKKIPGRAPSGQTTKAPPVTQQSLRQMPISDAFSAASGAVVDKATAAARDAAAGARRLVIQPATGSGGARQTINPNGTFGRQATQFTPLATAGMTALPVGATVLGLGALTPRPPGSGAPSQMKADVAPTSYNTESYGAWRAPDNLGIPMADLPGPLDDRLMPPVAAAAPAERTMAAPAPRPVQTDARRYEANGSPLPPSRPADLNGSSNILNRIFSGKDFQSNAREVMDNGKVNWGDSDSAADFFRASKAKMANPEASGENNTDLGMKRGGSIKGLTSHDVLHKALEVIHHMLTRGR